VDLPFALLDWPGMCCAALVVAAMVTLARNTPTWPLALAMLAPVVFGLRVFTLLAYVESTPFGDLLRVLVTGAVEAAVVLAVSIPLTVRAARSLRRLEIMSAPAPIGVT
jgi:hypothetical protein